jgi:hypothetical protein
MLRRKAKFYKIETRRRRMWMEVQMARMMYLKISKHIQSGRHNFTSNGPNSKTKETSAAKHE